MKLSELIAHVGDEHVQFQNLQRDLVNVRTNKKDGHITFATDRAKTLNMANVIVAGDGTQPQFLGLVVWLPTSRLPK